MADGDPTTFALALKSVTGDDIDLRPLSEGHWFVVSAGGADGQAGGGITYSAFGKTYLNVVVDSRAIGTYEQATDQLGPVIGELAAGQRGTLVASTISDFQAQALNLENYLRQAAGDFAQWSGDVASGAQFSGSAADLIAARLKESADGLDNWGGRLNASGQPLSSVIGEAGDALSAFRSAMSDAWAAATGGGLRDNIRSAVADQVAAVVAYLTEAGIVTGSSADQLTPLASTLPPDQFQATSEAKIQAALAAYPKGDLRAQSTWDAIDKEVTSTVSGLLDQLDQAAAAAISSLGSAYQRVVDAVNAYLGNTAPAQDPTGSSSPAGDAGTSGTGTGAGGGDAAPGTVSTFATTASADAPGTDSESGADTATTTDANVAQLDAGQAGDGDASAGEGAGEGAGAFAANTFAANSFAAPDGSGAAGAGTDLSTVDGQAGAGAGALSPAFLAAGSAGANGQAGSGASANGTPSTDGLPTDELPGQSTGEDSDVLAAFPLLSGSVGAGNGGGVSAGANTGKAASGVWTPKDAAGGLAIGDHSGAGGSAIGDDGGAGGGHDDRLSGGPLFLPTGVGAGAGTGPVAPELTSGALKSAPTLSAAMRGPSVPPIFGPGMAGRGTSGRTRQTWLTEDAEAWGTAAVAGAGVVGLSAADEERRAEIGEANAPVSVDLPAGGAVGRPATAPATGDEPKARNHGR